MKYTIIVRGEFDVLSQRVNQMLKLGWEVSGSLSMTSKGYGQALIKREQEKTKVKYKVLHERRSRQLEEAVNEHIEMGWELRGDWHIDSLGNYNQQMVRKCGK